MMMQGHSQESAFICTVLQLRLTKATFVAREHSVGMHAPVLIQYLLTAFQRRPPHIRRMLLAITSVIHHASRTQ